MDFGCAPNRLDGTRELGDDAVACASEHPSIVLLDQAINDLTMCPEGRKRPFLVCAHQSAVTNCVGREDNGYLALNTIQGHCQLGRLRTS